MDSIGIEEISVKKREFKWTQESTNLLIYDFDKNIEKFHNIENFSEFWRNLARRMNSKGYKEIKPNDCLSRFNYLGKTFKKIYLSEQQPEEPINFPYYDRLHQIMTLSKIPLEKYMVIVVQPPKSVHNT